MYVLVATDKKIDRKSKNLTMKLLKKMSSRFFSCIEILVTKVVTVKLVVALVRNFVSPGVFCFKKNKKVV